MKLTNRAKKRWFKDNIIYFEIYDRDFSSNTRVMKYCRDYRNVRGWLADLRHSDKAQSLLFWADDKQPWEIFFKCKGLARKSPNYEGLVMEYDKYTEDFLKENV